MKTDSPVFVTFTKNALKIHDAKNGIVIATKYVPMPAGSYIVDANSDITGKYVTVSCSNRKIFVYKKSGSTSWQIYKQYLH